MGKFGHEFVILDHTWLNMHPNHSMVDKLGMANLKKYKFLINIPVMTHLLDIFDFLTTNMIYHIPVSSNRILFLLYLQCILLILQLRIDMILIEYA